MAAGLSAAGFPAGYVSARLAQSERSGAVAQFRAFSLRLLVCTDLLARGVDFGETAETSPHPPRLDVEDTSPDLSATCPTGRVSLVIHLDAPRELPTYLHRVGRTGRYGAAPAHPPFSLTLSSAQPEPTSLPTWPHPPPFGAIPRGAGTLGASVLLLSKRQWAEFAPIAAALRHRLQPLPADLREDDYLQQRAFSADEAPQTARCRVLPDRPRVSSFL